MKSAATPSARWVSIETAASILSLSAAALRRSIERRAQRVADGGIEARLDGIRARKLGRIWRVSLGASWTLDEPTSDRVGSRRRGDGGDDREDGRS